MTVTYRSLMLFEFMLYAEHLKRLSDADRYMRFEALVPDEAIDRYVAGIRRANAVVIGVFDGEGELRGAAHVARVGRSAELGLSVEKGFRGRGLGSQLLDEAISSARILGASSFCALCLARNGWMRRQLRKRGFELSREGGCILAERDLLPANPPLLAAAIVRDSLGWVWNLSHAVFGSAQQLAAAAMREREMSAT